MKETPEEAAAFVAEMMQLAKAPGMRPYLTSTEEKRQERERLKEAEAEQKRKEAWLLEAKRRDMITQAWFNRHMSELFPRGWKSFKKDGNVQALNKAGWELIADMTTAVKPGFEPVPVTVCSIKRFGKVKKIERLVWEELKPVASKILPADAPVKLITPPQGIITK